jgi:hypothetical protein
MCDLNKQQFEAFKNVVKTLVDRVAIEFAVAGGDIHHKQDYGLFIVSINGVEKEFDPDCKNGVAVGELQVLANKLIDGKIKPRMRNVA